MVHTVTRPSVTSIRGWAEAGSGLTSAATRAPSTAARMSAVVRPVVNASWTNAARPVTAKTLAAASSFDAGAAGAGAFQCCCLFSRLKVTSAPRAPRSFPADTGALPSGTSPVAHAHSSGGGALPQGASPASAWPPGSIPGSSSRFGVTPSTTARAARSSTLALRSPFSVLSSAVSATEWPIAAHRRSISAKPRPRSWRMRFRLAATSLAVGLGSRSCRWGSKPSGWTGGATGTVGSGYVDRLTKDSFDYGRMRCPWRASLRGHWHPSEEVAEYLDVPTGHPQTLAADEDRTNATT